MVATAARDPQNLATLRAIRSVGDRSDGAPSIFAKNLQEMKHIPFADKPAKCRLLGDVLARFTELCRKIFKFRQPSRMGRTVSA